jgi:crotonobetainyl-CoA:carnitine CoA-transferase CaiB-like acyl-CoA transferase
MAGPLAGVRIVDMSTVVFGPFATMIMGDLGAEVIKIENPSGRQPGDDMRYAGRSPTGDLGPIFMALNRNKKSVALDCKTPDGHAALALLLKDTDVFFHNVRTEGMKRLGFSYEDVKAINPSIVYVHCSGFDANGQYGGRPAYDDLIQAASGYSALYEMRDGAGPGYAPGLIADKTTGLFAVYATLAALYHRERTGEGQFVQVPMFESFTFFNLVENLYGETFVPATGRMGYTRSVNPRRKPYRTKDGYIAIVPYSDGQWAEFFRLGGRDGVFRDPRFSTYKARTENSEALYGIIEDVALSRTTAEWLDVLTKAGIPVMCYNTLSDVLRDPHLKSIDFFQEAMHPKAGLHRSMRHPVRFSGTPIDLAKPAPTLGADTDDIIQPAGRLLKTD